MLPAAAYNAANRLISPVCRGRLPADPTEYARVCAFP